jgi:hypothetical protein
LLVENHHNGHGCWKYRQSINDRDSETWGILSNTPSKANDCIFLYGPTTLVCPTNGFDAR